jgi:hypothetical protein
MILKRVVALLALVTGVLGLVACVAAFYPVWLVQSRLDQANERAFTLLDKGLASAEDRVRGVQKRVQESKQGVSEIVQGVRAWSASRAKERLVPAAEIERRIEKLAGHLQTADEWMETSTELIRGMQQIMELFGAAVDLSSLKDVLDELGSIRSKLQETEQRVTGVREFMHDRAGESEQNRLSRVLKLLGSIDLSATAINNLLEDSIARLSQLDAEAQQWKARVGHYISLTALGAYLVLAWLAVGQGALCLCGWKGCRSRSWE